MSSSRLGFLSSLVLVALSACSSADDTTDLGGTGPEDGKFVPPPVKPEDGQKSSTEAPAPNTPKTDTPAKPPAGTPAPGGAAGSCGVPQCTGFAGFCGCRGGSEGKQTIMACSGGTCRCNDKSFDAKDACGAQPNADGLKALFASCGCT